VVLEAEDGADEIVGGSGGPGGRGGEDGVLDELEERDVS